MTRWSQCSHLFLISNIRHVVKVVFFILGDSLAQHSEMSAHKIQMLGNHQKKEYNSHLLYGLAVSTEDDSRLLLQHFEYCLCSVIMERILGIYC